MTIAASLEQQAVEFARRGDFGADARSLNEQLTRLSPANQGAWTRLARCCLELGELDAAASALDEALRVNPQNTIARNLHQEVDRRRAGPAEPARPRRRASSGGRRSTGMAAAAGIGRAEFTTLGGLQPAVAAEALSGRLDPLLMALNERPFAGRIVEARNRAGHAGARLFRRGSVQAGPPGHIYVMQQGGRWEPQLTIGLYAAAQFGRDCLSAGLAFDLSPGQQAGDRSEAGAERAAAYFEAFQQQAASTWRVHLTEWMRANGGFVQIGAEPPATDRLPADSVADLVSMQGAGADARIFCGHALFADRGEDVGVLTDGPRLLRWIEGTFTDLLPLWTTIYRGLRSQ